MVNMKGLALSLVLGLMLTGCASFPYHLRDAACVTGQLVIESVRGAATESTLCDNLGGDAGNFNGGKYERKP